MRSRKNIGSRLLMTIFAVLTGLNLVSAVLAAQLSKDIAYVPNEYLVRVKSGTSLANVVKQASKMGGTVVQKLPMDEDVYLIRMGKVGRKYKTPYTKWSVDYVQPNYVYQAAEIPDDPLYGGGDSDYAGANGWDMNLIGMPDAWGLKDKDGNSIYTKGVVVAVLDTGVACVGPVGGPTVVHEDLDGRILDGASYISYWPSNYGGNHSEPIDLDGHGTHVTGTIVAAGNNTKGICGVAGLVSDIKVLPVQVLAYDGYGTIGGIVSGLDYALTHTDGDGNRDVKVVNMSLAGSKSYYDYIMRSKVRELSRESIIIVVAAGNEGNVVGSPACFSECIAVGATDSAGEQTYYSNFGYELDVMAPGGNDYEDGPGAVWSVWPKWLDTEGNIWVADSDLKWTPTLLTATKSLDDPPVPLLPLYKSINGTSMACPHVAGEAALLLSAGISPDEVRQRIVDTASHPEWPTYYEGAGLVNVYQAIAGANVSIKYPEYNAKVGQSPVFSVKVYGLEHDETTTKPVITATITDSNSNTYPVGNISWSADNRIAQFSAVGQLPPGMYTLEVSGNAWPVRRYGENNVEVPVTASTSFNVIRTTIKKSLSNAPYQLVALPYVLNTSSVTPEQLFGVAFSAKTAANATNILWRHVPGVDLNGDASSKGIDVNYPESDLAWTDPLMTDTDVYGDEYTVYTGGGWSVDDPSRMSIFPAGSAFWLKLATDAAFDNAYASGSTLITAPMGVTIPLYRGWNYIGNPYPQAVSGDVILNYGGRAYHIVGDRSLVSRFVEPNLYKYEVPSTLVGKGRFVRVNSAQEMLQPYRGYAIYVKPGFGALDPDSAKAISITIMP